MSSSTPAAFLAMHVYAPVSSKCTLLTCTSLPLALGRGRTRRVRKTQTVDLIVLIHLIVKVVSVVVKVGVLMVVVLVEVVT